MAEGNGVTYTTKELLARIEHKIELLDTKLDSKVDVTVVQSLDSRISALRDDQQNLRNEIAQQDKINAALAKAAKEQADKAVNQFTRKEKGFAMLVAFIAAVAQLYVLVQSIRGR